MLEKFNKSFLKLEEFFFDFSAKFLTKKTNKSRQFVPRGDFLELKLAVGD